jgi:dihydropteroate synthase
MARIAAKYNVPVVIMHMRGRPSTMQLDPRYDDVIEEIISGLEESIEIGERAGIEKNRIIIDPGIGFGKNLEHNLRIIKELYKFKRLKRPIMIGVSRKSFIGNILGRDTGERLMGTASGVALSIVNGANIIRVHDVKEMVDVAKVADSIWRI